MKILKKITAITTAVVLLTAGNLSVLPAGAVSDSAVSASASEDGIMRPVNMVLRVITSQTQHQSRQLLLQQIAKKII